MAGNTAAGNVEGFIWISMNAFHHTALTFVGQHVGARKIKKIPRIIAMNILFVSLTGIGLALCVLLGRYPLLSLYLDDPAIIETAIHRLLVIASTYFICGIMDVLTGVLRGLGNSMIPMILTVICVCGVRITWVLTIFKMLRGESYAHVILYLCFPVSWVLAVVSMLIAVVIIYRRVKRECLCAEIS